MAAASSCPPGHLAYLSEAVAANAVTLHVWLEPDCGGFEWFPCGDHFHVGHHTRAIGRACKAAAAVRPRYA